jgi:hypothetical protein
VESARQGGITTGIVLLAVPLLAVAVIGIIARPDTDPVAPAATAQPASASAPSASQGSQLHIGDSVTTGDPDTAQRVTVEEVRTGLQSTPGDSPGPGRDLIGIRVTIENAGKTGIVDSSGGTWSALQWNMYDQNGHEIPLEIGPHENTIGKSLPNYRLQPGQTATGWINLTAPVGTTVATVTLTTSSDTTEWTVPAETLPATSPTGEATK